MSKLGCCAGGVGEWLSDGERYYLYYKETCGQSSLPLTPVFLGNCFGYVVLRGCLAAELVDLGPMVLWVLTVFAVICGLFLPRLVCGVFLLS